MSSVTVGSSRVAHTGQSRSAGRSLVAVGFGCRRCSTRAPQVLPQPLRHHCGMSIAHQVAEAPGLAPRPWTQGPVSVPGRCGRGGSRAVTPGPPMLLLVASLLFPRTAWTLFRRSSPPCLQASLCRGVTVGQRACRRKRIEVTGCPRRDDVPRAHGRCPPSLSLQCLPPSRA